MWHAKHQQSICEPVSVNHIWGPIKLFLTCCAFYLGPSEGSTAGEIALGRRELQLGLAGQVCCSLAGLFADFEGQARTEPEQSQWKETQTPKSCSLHSLPSNQNVTCQVTSHGALNGGKDPRTWRQISSVGSVSQDKDQLEPFWGNCVILL